MPRIQPIQPEQAEGKTRQLLDQAREKMGQVPNILKTMAHSPAVLQAYLSFGEAMGASSLEAPLREKIALTVAGRNGCDYCASAHTAIGKKLGLEEKALEGALKGEASDPREQSLLDFAARVVEKKGWVDPEALQTVRQAGWSEAQVLETVGAVVQNIFTNYVNHIADTEIDFPQVTTQVQAGRVQTGQAQGGTA